MTEPIPPSPESAPPPVPPESVKPLADTTGLAPNIAAGLACLFSLVSGIVFLVLEKRDQFVRYWAMQSVFLGGVGVAASIFFQIAGLILRTLPLIGGLMGVLCWLLGSVVTLGVFIVYIITVVKAFSKQEWDIPVIGKLARQQLAHLDARVPTSI